MVSPALSRPFRSLPALSSKSWTGLSVGFRKLRASDCGWKRFQPAFYHLCPVALLVIWILVFLPSCMEIRPSNLTTRKDPALIHYPSSFISNQEQVDEHVKSFGRSGPSSLLLARDEAVHSFAAESIDPSLTVTNGGGAGNIIFFDPPGIYCGAADNFAVTCSITYTAGTNVTLTAIPATNSVFMGWSGDCSGTNITCMVTMDGNRSAKVTFAKLPVPDIKVNGSDGPVTISEGNLLTVTASLDPGSHDNEDADWWVAATSPFGVYWYTLELGWLRSDAPIRVYGGPLFNFSPYEVLNSVDLPTGTYVFYFGVDSLKNGSWDFDHLFLDSVNVNIEKR